jgi:hypothetical protein
VQTTNKILVPKLYYYGPRKLNMILTQIRCTASFLSHDLHKVHILSSPACSCGAPQEDANHFFFVCTKYSEIRNYLFLSISDLSQFINTSLLIAMSSLFHSLTVEGINDELVVESLQKGTIKLSPFRKGYIVVLCIVGGTRWRKYSGAIPHFILKNNWSFLRYLRSDSVSLPVSAYKYSDFVKLGKPVTILAASNWSFSNLSE